MKQLTPLQRYGILYRLGQGESVRSVSRSIGCSKSTVQIWAKRGPDISRKRRVVKKVLVGDTAAKRALQLLKGQQQGGARFVGHQLFSEGLVGRVPSRQTVVLAAKRAAIAAGDPIKFVRGPPKKGLTAKQKSKRIAFCRACMHRDWTKVMSTDRCRFVFRYPGSKVHAGQWLAASEKEKQSVYMPNHPQCYNVYGGITAYGVTKLIPVTGTSCMKTEFKTKTRQPSRNITSDEYSKVVREGFLACGEGIFSRVGKRKWVLQQDGDPAHGAARPVIAQYNELGQSSVKILPNWPGNSPDLSPIENVWSIVGSKVDSLGCRSFDEYKQAVDRTFHNLPQSTLRNLFKSMSKRMSACVAAEGGRIKY